MTELVTTVIYIRQHAVLNGIFAPEDVPNDIAKQVEDAFAKGMK